MRDTELLYWKIGERFVRFQANGVNIEPIVRQLRRDGVEVEEAGYGFDELTNIHLADLRHGDEILLIEVARKQGFKTRLIRAAE